MDTWKELFGWLGGSAIKGLFQVVGQSTTDAAATAIYLATSPEVESKDQKGKYFIPIATEDKPSKVAEDKDLAKNLWYWCDDKATKCEWFKKMCEGSLTLCRSRQGLGRKSSTYGIEG